jgi:hypothetical protein
VFALVGWKRPVRGRWFTGRRRDGATSRAGTEHEHVESARPGHELSVYALAWDGTCTRAGRSSRRAAFRRTHREVDLALAGALAGSGMNRMNAFVGRSGLTRAGLHDGGGVSATSRVGRPSWSAGWA